MRAPDAPIGWPSAMPPPLTFTMSIGTPSSLTDWIDTLANASLISTRSRSPRVRPCLARACLMALAGCDCSEVSGPATLPCAPISASHGRPSSSALALDMTTTAQAPSEICEAEPAVIVPSGCERGPQPGQRLRGGVAAYALVLVDDHGSPRAAGSPPATISASNTPFFMAAAASWWERAETSSCSSRPMPSACCSARSTRPSRTGRTRRTGRRRPSSRPRRRPVLDALAQARQQVRGVRHRLHAARDHDVELAGADELVGQGDRVEARQADLVDVIDGTVIGMPALTAAWRDGIWPAPAWSTWPMITYSTASGATPARSSAALIAMPPRSTADSPTARRATCRWAYGPRRR